MRIWATLGVAVGALWVSAGEARAGTVSIFSDATSIPGSSAINSFYNGNGHTSSTSTSSITSAALAGVDLLIGWDRRTSYSATEISAMNTFLAGGGRIAFFGENDLFDLENNIINAALTGLGSTMQIGTVGDVFFDTGYNTASGAQITSHFLNAGVSSFEYGAPNNLLNVSGGNAIFLAKDFTTVFSAFDGLAGDGIVVMTDSNVVNFGTGFNNARWFLNLVEVNNPAVVPLPPSGFMGLTLLGGLGLAKVLRNRRKATLA